MGGRVGERAGAGSTQVDQPLFKHIAHVGQVTGDGGGGGHDRADQMGARVGERAGADSTQVEKLPLPYSAAAAEGFLPLIFSAASIQARS